MVNQGRTLILRRGPTAPWMPGLWNLPGGEINEGETPPGAACRECLEESGITPYNLQFLTTVHDPEFDLHLFRGEAATKDVTICWESDGYAWVTANDLEHYQFVPYIETLLRKVLS